MDAHHEHNGNICAAFPDGKHVFDFFIAEGDSVATIGRYRGRHMRPFMGVAVAEIIAKKIYHRGDHEEKSDVTQSVWTKPRRGETLRARRHR